MGTYYTYGATKQDIIRELTEENAMPNHRAIAQSLVGNNLWVVIGHKEDTTKDRALLLFSLKSDRDGWGYKPADESMGPYESDCPLKLIAMLPEPPNQYAADFRERVKAFHYSRSDKRKKRNAIQIGETIALRPGISVLGTPVSKTRVDSIKPFRGTVYAEDGSYIAGNVKLAPRYLAI
jgi:hypothetical protein